MDYKHYNYYEIVNLKCKGSESNVIVYIDILIVTNIIINYFLLLLTVKYCSYRVKRQRILFSSLIGGIYSLVLLATNFSFVIILILKLVCCFFMVTVLFGKKDFFKNYYIFLIINLIFSGCILVLWFFVAPPGMQVNNGVVYFNISTKMLVISIIVSYGAINLFNLVAKKVPVDLIDYLVTIGIEKNFVTLKGFVDTGNFLKDVFSSTPVVMCRFQSIKNILPENIKNLVLTPLTNNNLNNLTHHVRFIPYKTVSNKQIIVAFKPDEFILQSESGNLVINDVYVGILPDDELINNTYDVILNPQLIR